MTILTNYLELIGINLSDTQIDQLYRYRKLLIEWNKNINLTAISDPKAILLKHFLDSISVHLVEPICDNEAFKIIDVGSGAGFPGLVLKIVFPKSNVTLLEATNKKVKFLEFVKGELELTDLNIIRTRAENAGHNILFRENFDLVVARGVARLPTLSEITLPFCKIKGVCVLHKGPNAHIEVADSLTAIKTMGGFKTELFPITHELDMTKTKTVFVKITKSRQTPVKFPRPDGVPKKHPL
ncbi:MAG: 16S rRNA (guanine(527)-N(7))-methyltransferase RsmG [Dehalococcoidia bacterium]|nr:16S rRNA (guanine(527)-N(7))-methyltransferase RsmG [Dehalococcoidia bacterium]MAX04622.1 16S rRNA (guanine(527)-N(7))-methyltransferase RsmG [Dehalococcoidia bacterium]|tara:strand:- start:631 stop:1350 length:720 start_codon:yes stop_codon:yes gene_type:complete